MGGWGGRALARAACDPDAGAVEVWASVLPFRLVFPLPLGCPEVWGVCPFLAGVAPAWCWLPRRYQRTLPPRRSRCFFASTRRRLEEEVHSLLRAEGRFLVQRRLRSLRHSPRGRRRRRLVRYRQSLVHSPSGPMESTLWVVPHVHFLETWLAYAPPISAHFALPCRHDVGCGSRRPPSCHYHGL